MYNGTLTPKFASHGARQAPIGYRNFGPDCGRGWVTWKSPCIREDGRTRVAQREPSYLPAA